MHELISRLSLSSHILAPAPAYATITIKASKKRQQANWRVSGRRTFHLLPGAGVVVNILSSGLIEIRQLSNFCLKAANLQSCNQSNMETWAQALIAASAAIVGLIIIIVLIVIISKRRSKSRRAAAQGRHLRKT